MLLLQDDTESNQSERYAHTLHMQTLVCIMRFPTGREMGKRNFGTQMFCSGAASHTKNSLVRNKLLVNIS